VKQEIIKKNMSVLMKLMQDITYSKQDGDNTINKNIRVIQASREKMFDQFKDIRNNSSNLSISNVIPVITLLIESTQYNSELKLQHIQEVVENGQVAYTPVPYSLTYHGNIFTHQLDTLFEILEQLQEKFDPYSTINIRYMNGFSKIATPFVFQAGGLTTDIDYDVAGDRIVMFDFTISTFYYVYKTFVPNNNKKLVVEFDGVNPSFIIEKTI
jgi:hypothetical protein